MRNRKWLLLLLFVVLLALSISYFAMHSGTPDADLMAKFEQVQLGMTLDELKAFLGTPTRFARAAAPAANRPGAVATWEVGDTVLRVTFDGDLKLTAKSCGIKSIGRRLDDLMDRLFAPKRVIAPPKSVNAVPGDDQ